MNIKPAVDPRIYSETLILAWADRPARERVIALALQERRQTMNLRTKPGAELVVVRRLNGEFAGWAGVDVDTDPAYPEVFSQFVYPRFRGMGLGALLEHLWWAYLDSRACAVGYMRMELDSNETLVKRRLSSGYCRQVAVEGLAPRFVRSCHGCELFGAPCRRQIYLAVDVRKALAACVEARGDLDIDSLPMSVNVERRDAFFVASEARTRLDSQLLQTPSPT